MAYLVIKTIKGNRYVYRQESYRIGGKVMTNSQCLGREDTVGTIADIKAKTGQSQQQTKPHDIKSIQGQTQAVVNPIVSELTVSEEIQETRKESFYILRKPGFDQNIKHEKNEYEEKILEFTNEQMKEWEKTKIQEKVKKSESSQTQEIPKTKLEKPKLKSVNPAPKEESTKPMDKPKKGVNTTKKEPHRTVDERLII